MTHFDLKDIVRPNIYALQPYRCARDDYKSGILLDANENTHGSSLKGDQDELNRYPDPHQMELKGLFCDLRNILSNGTANDSKTQPSEKVFEGLSNGLSVKADSGPLKSENCFIGVGSDECIDNLMRVFGTPGRDKVLVCPPSYGMYTVSANINDLELVKVPLKPKDFSLDVKNIIKTVEEDRSIRLMFLCSPGNPTSKLLDSADIKAILESTYRGIVVVDEAYIDFSPPEASVAYWATRYPNLAVMQTLSKAFGLAGARVGICFTSVDIARILNSLKAPYNISSLNSNAAKKALSVEGLDIMRENIQKIKDERRIVVDRLRGMSGIGEIRGGGEDGNFVLVEILDNGKISSDKAYRVYEEMAEEHGIVVRFRGKELHCEGCLRLTIGTHEENIQMLNKLDELTK